MNGRIAAAITERKPRRMAAKMMVLTTLRFACSCKAGSVVWL